VSCIPRSRTTTRVRDSTTETTASGPRYVLLMSLASFLYQMRTGSFIYLPCKMFRLFTLKDLSITHTVVNCLTRFFASSFLDSATWFNCENGVSYHIKNLLLMRLIHMWRSRTPAGVRCAHFPSVITTIMYHKL
jgi:hypothetical protein